MLPVFWSSATKLPSSWPLKIMPWPEPTPRLSQPQQIRSLTWGMSELYSHNFLPVLPSMAKMSSLPVGMYITPSTTSGSASKMYLLPRPEPRRFSQAPLSWLTLLVLTWSSVEYRPLVRAPPYVIQLAPALFVVVNSWSLGDRNDCARALAGRSSTAATAAAAKRDAKRRTPHPLLA